MRLLVWTLVALAVAGCKKGEGAVNVALSATQTLSNVTSLLVTRTDRSSPKQSITRLPSDMITTSSRLFFAVDVSADTTSTLALHVDALSAAHIVGAGDGTAPVQGGRSTTMNVTLVASGNPAVGDLGTDLQPGPADLATNPADLYGVPVCTFDKAGSLLGSCVFAQ